MNNFTKLIKAKKESLIKRFLSKINKTDTCWLWKGAPDGSGYGELRYGRHTVKAHRVSWEYYNGKTIPQGMLVCHSCDTPLCVNPNHLFLGTDATNGMDKINKFRGAMKLTKEEVIEIRQILAERRVTQTEIAKRFKIDQSCVSRIGNRIYWQQPETQLN